MKNTIIISILLFLVITSCTRNLKSNLDLESEIWDHIQTTDSTFCFSLINSFEWDSLIIISPYTYLDRLEDTLGYDFKSLEHTGIEYLDHFNLIAFIHEGEINNIVEYPRNQGDFVLTEEKFIKKEDAVYDVILTDRTSVSVSQWIELKRLKSTTPNNR